MKEKDKLTRTDGIKRQVNNVLCKEKGKIKFKKKKIENKFDNSIEEELGIINHDNLYDNLTEKLKKKQVLYDKLKSRGKDANLLNLSDEENVALSGNKIKKQFLVDFDFELNNNNQKFQNNKLWDFNNFELTDNEINFDTEEVCKNVLVKQSYDKKLSCEEKIALEEIKVEEKDYKKNIEFLKKKKNQEREERLERIKKMKIDI